MRNHEAKQSILEAKFVAQTTGNRVQREENYTTDAFTYPNTNESIGISSRPSGPSAMLGEELTSDSEDIEYGVHTTSQQPRPEIILRWKRFGLLVISSSTFLCLLAYILMNGIDIGKYPNKKEADDISGIIDMWAGVSMGIVETFLSILLEYFFPVFIVYLHNLKWYPGDDPALKLNKFKKVLLLLFFPVVMVAIGGSFSGVQAHEKSNSNASENRMRSRHLQAMNDTSSSSTLYNTILQTAIDRYVHPMEDNFDCLQEGNNINQYKLARSTSVVFGFPLKSWQKKINIWKNIDEVPETVISYNTRQDISQIPMDLSTAWSLVLQGYQSTFNGQHIEKEDTTHPKTVEELMDGIVNKFSSLPVDIDDLTVKFKSASWTSNLKAESMVLEIPLTYNAGTYGECKHSKGCVWMDSQSHALPNQQVSISPYQSIPNASFVYGVAVTSQSLIMSFMKYSWSPTQDLIFQLPNDEEILHVSQEQVPQIKNTRLVHLLEPKFDDGAALRYYPTSFSSTASCSKREAYLQYTKRNHLYMTKETLFPTMIGSTLFYHFQNAEVVTIKHSQDISMALKLHHQRIQRRQRQLQATASNSNGQRYKAIYIANTNIGKISSIIGCTALIILAAAVVLFPNERARLNPGGSNARAEKFVRVQTEQIYPNLTYRKRLIIGSTGEKIKFKEFSVESVGLHHYMEVDEEIRL